MNTLGQNIKTARLAANMSQEKLADIVHVSPGAISHYDNDRYRPANEVLEAISVALGVNVEELEKSDRPPRTGRVRTDEFSDLGEEEIRMLRRIWNVVVDYVAIRSK